MWSISEIKERGKTAFRSNYWPSVGAAFLLYLLLGIFFSVSVNEIRGDEFQSAINQLDPGQQRTLIIILISAVATITIVTILLRIFLFNPLQVGCYRFFRKNAEGQPTQGSIKEGFGQYGHVFATLFIRDLFLFLWTCLFIIPGLIKFYSYRMVPYIIKDEPDLSATEVISRSKQMMVGNKWRAFLLDLSFIGWLILGAITLNIVNIFWTNPYLENARGALYLELKN